LKTLLNGELFDKWGGTVDSPQFVSIYDQSVMYAFSVFEMVRTFSMLPFKLHEHLDRLMNSVKYLGIDLPLTVSDLAEWYDMLMEANKGEFSPDDEIRTFIKVSPGVVPVYEKLVPELMRKPWVMMTVLPQRMFTKGMYPLYQKGVNAFIARQRQIPADLLESKVKNHCRIHYKLAEQEAVLPDDYPLLLDPDGYITEGAGANFLTIKDGTIYSPESRNILWGITMQYVLEMAEMEGLKVKYTNMNSWHVMTSDEAMFTSTVFSILPCTSIDGKAIGNGGVGPMTEKLIQRWIKREHCDWREQVREWG